MKPGIALEAATSPPAEAAHRKKLEQAADAFEAMFVRMLLKRMRDAQLENGFFGKGAGSSVYEGMFEQTMSEELARTSPFGIADVLLEQWTGGGEVAEVGPIFKELRRAEAGQAYEDLLRAAPQVTGPAADESGEPEPESERGLRKGKE